MKNNSIKVGFSRKLIVNGLLFAISLCTVTPLFAAGFQINEQSARTLGQANAGTAVTDDASIQFFNPAGMTQMSGPVASIVGAVIQPNADFETEFANDFLGRPIRGNQQSLAVTALVPSIYYIRPLSQRLFAGIGITAPYGLSTHYNDQSFARYFATKSSLLTININPSLAYKINEYFSVGAGFSAQRLEAELDQAFDFNSFSPFPRPDVFIHNNANSWGYGWNAGVLFQVPGSKVGLSYRSLIKHKLRGDTNILGVPGDVFSQSLARFLGLSDGNVAADVTLPDSLVLSMSHDLTDRLTLVADAAYTFWNRIQQITLTFSGNVVNLPPSTLELNYSNTWRLAVGQIFKVNDNIKWRAGVAYDQTPADPLSLTVRLPDSDRFWAATGFSFRLAKQWLLDLSYAHLVLQSHRLPQTRRLPFGTVNGFIGKFNQSANLAAIQVTYEFDK